MATTYKLPLKQHIGAPDEPVVKIGETIRRGAVVARAKGLGADIHASVSGRVIDISETFIEIGYDPSIEDGFDPIPDEGSIVDKVRAAGIVGMGGAGFPTHVKLSTDLAGGTILANGAECEPLLGHNIQQITEDPGILYRGMKYAMEATNAAHGVLAIKQKNAEAIASFRQVLKPDDNITIHELPDLYPMGEERAVVREVLGTTLAVDQLPAAAGAVVLNVETLACITRAVEDLRPVMTKNVTVLGKIGDGRTLRVFMDVPIGTTVRELIDRAGGFDGEYGEIIMGGPFTGKAVQPGDVITKTTGGIIVTMEFPRVKQPLGLLVCACGGNEERMRDIAAKMDANVVSVRCCKQAKDVRGTLKCENPGNCPGQAEKIMELYKEGARALLVGNCSDCTNTVMCVAPKLKLPVYHQTDHVMRTMGHSLIRRLPVNE
ncbi:MAG: proline reductase-associated electron transfer protein PrdC [Desulfovibrio sp.]|uniref:proline reductase-associated electron transfer protein PrdC n=1 Tax=Desulfovibrio sp. 7SRBS1 TaxID=3378064 RepID=UPI003B3E2900